MRVCARPVVKVTDTESGKVITPNSLEEVLKLSERLRDLQSDLGIRLDLFNKTGIDIKEVF